MGEFRRFVSASFSKGCPTFARSLKLGYNIHKRHCQVIFKCLCSHVATPESQRQCSPSTPAGSVLPRLPPLGHGLPLGVTTILPSRFKSYVSNSTKNFPGELSQSVGTGWVHNSPPLSSGCFLFSSHLPSLLCFILEARSQINTCSKSLSLSASRGPPLRRVMCPSSTTVGRQGQTRSPGHQPLAHQPEEGSPTVPRAVWPSQPTGQPSPANSHSFLPYSRPLSVILATRPGLAPRAWGVDVSSTLSSRESRAPAKALILDSRCSGPGGALLP